MAAATETTARPGTKAKVRYVRMSASKVRVVLNLIRGKRVTEAIEILDFSERLAAKEILNCLNSAVANAEHNEDIPVDELFISACFADQGPTLRRFRPRARGRAGRIQKQTCHITIEVSRLTSDELDEIREREERSAAGRATSKKSSGGDRAARVAKSRASDAGTAAEADANADDVADVEEQDVEVEETAEDVAEAEAEATEAEAAETEAAEADDAEDEVADAEDSEDTDADASDDAGEEE